MGQTVCLAILGIEPVHGYAHWCRADDLDPDALLLMFDQEVWAGVLTGKRQADFFHLISEHYLRELLPKSIVIL